MMRLTLRDPEGHEAGFIHAAGPRDAPQQAAMLLVQRDRLEPGAALIVEDDAAAPGPLAMLSANGVAALAQRLEHRAHLIENDQPEAAADGRLAARIARLALREGLFMTPVDL